MAAIDPSNHPVNLPLDRERRPAIEGLVLRVFDYRDHDGIVHVATPERIWSVYARGIQKETSKNRRLSLPFSRVRLNYDPQYSRSMLYLINGSVEEAWWKNTQSLELQGVNAIVCLLIERHSINPFLYTHLEEGWKAGQQENLPEAFKHACLIAAEILRQSGTLMNVAECAVCGSLQQISGVSMEAGGFVCKNHLDASTRRWPKKRLLQLRRLVQAVSMPDFPFERLNEFDWDLEFFLFLADWYVYENDMPVPSLDFLKTLL